MRANVGTESEWSSAAHDLDSFVDCATTLFERFSITGKLPDHPLLSESGTDANGNHGDPPQSPSSAAGSSNGKIVVDGGGNDPRGSPGAISPGVRSPGLPPCWLGPGERRGSRRASTPVGKSDATSARSGGVKRGHGKKTSDHRAAAVADEGGSDDPGGASFIASPPRPRSRSAAVGSGRIVGREAPVGDRGGVGGRESPGKSRRRVFKRKDSRNSDVRASSGVPPTTSANITRLSSDAKGVDSTGSCVDEDQTALHLLSPSPSRLPV